MITLSKTDEQHHGRSNHASTTGIGTTRLAQPAHIRNRLCDQHGIANHIAPAAQRIGIQLPQAPTETPSKPNDLAREAVSCNAGLGGSSTRCCADLYPPVAVSRGHISSGMC